MQTVNEFRAESGFIKGNCSSIEFFVPASVEGGTTYNTCVVIGRPLTPGTAWSINQLEQDFDITDYEFVFEGNDTNALFITRVMAADGTFDLIEGA